MLALLTYYAAPPARPCRNGLGKSTLLNFLGLINLDDSGYVLPADDRPGPSSGAALRPQCRLAAELEEAELEPRLVFNPRPTDNTDHVQRAAEALEDYWHSGAADLVNDTLLLPVGCRTGTTTQVPPR